MADPEKTLVPGDVTYESKSDAIRGGRSPLDDFKSSVKEFAQKLPGQIGRAIETIQARMNAITVQVDDSLAHADSVIERTAMETRAEHAAALVHAPAPAYEPTEDDYVDVDVDVEEDEDVVDEDETEDEDRPAAPVIARERDEGEETEGGRSRGRRRRRGRRGDEPREAAPQRTAVFYQDST